MVGIMITPADLARMLAHAADDHAQNPLEPDELLQIELYIWLEGQDTDCVGQVDQARILASIQFKADPANQSGMEPIS